MGQATCCDGRSKNHFRLQNVSLAYWGPCCASIERAPLSDRGLLRLDPGDEFPEHSEVSQKHTSHKMAVQKIQVVVQKMQVKPSFSVERYTSDRRPTGVGCWRAGRPSARKAAMKRCALCHGKLGLGARFRNMWNGRWWARVRFCSARCEAIYQVKRNDAAKDRWFAFLARGNSPS
jgi:hypothetical protein